MSKEIQTENICVISEERLKHEEMKDMVYNLIKTGMIFNLSNEEIVMKFPHRTILNERKLYEYIKFMKSIASAIRDKVNEIDIMPFLNDLSLDILNDDIYKIIVLQNSIPVLKSSLYSTILIKTNHEGEIPIDPFSEYYIFMIEDGIREINDYYDSDTILNLVLYLINKENGTIKITTLTDEQNFRIKKILVSMSDEIKNISHKNQDTINNEIFYMKLRHGLFYIIRYILFHDGSDGNNYYEIFKEVLFKLFQEEKIIKEETNEPIQRRTKEVIRNSTIGTIRTKKQIHELLENDNKWKKRLIRLPEKTIQMYYVELNQLENVMKYKGIEFFVNNNSTDKEIYLQYMKEKIKSLKRKL